MERVKCNEHGVERAVKAVRGGGVVVYPTDTVYGIGCDPYSSFAVQRVRRIKGRDPTKQLPVLARSASAAAKIAVMGPNAKRLAAAFWPGKLTMVLKLADERLCRSMGLVDTVAVRVPGGRCVQEMLRSCTYMVGTSANASGEEPARETGQLTSMECDVLVDGGVTSGGVSTIVDATGSGVKQIRNGAVHIREVEEAL